MASRQMRRSGLSSPRSHSTRDTVSTKQEDQSHVSVGADLDAWEEPPLRNPVPSFEDHKGLERHGVLEHMAPLGALPNSKVKARMRQSEPSRRTAQVKSGEARATRDEVSTPEPAPPPATRHSVPRNEERPQQESSSREQGEGRDCKTRGLPKTTPVPTSPTRPTTAISPTSQSAAAKIRWKRIIDSAVKRAGDLGNPELGLAIRKLYDESTQNPVLADLLDAILSQRATKQQAAAFQVYVKAARKQLKKSKDQTHRSTLSESRSPAKNLRNSATRQLETSNSTDQADFYHLPSTSSQISSKPPTSYMATNGSPSKDVRPSKRIKRSDSASSDSSLSSLDSDVEDFAPDRVESTISKNNINHAPSPKPRAIPAVGPRLGSFAANRNYDAIRQAFPDDNPEARIAARRRLQGIKSFHDYAVSESSVRPSLSLPPQVTPQLTALQQRTQQPRRNGIAHRNKRLDEDSLESPASSVGDFLAPPPLGARGATPTNLGRPPKALKKAARVKQS
ncbi:MAG: hypothetical protein Q9164_005002 [Protoblastenia rupestris]